MRQLNTSASVMGRALAKASTADDIKAVRATANQQLGAADAARISITRLRVPSEDAPAWHDLVRAAGRYRGYVILVRRAVTLKAPKGVPAAKTASTRARAAGRAFKQVMSANPGISLATATSAGIGSNAGLVAAIKDATPVPAPTRAPARTYTPPPAPAVKVSF